MHWRKVGRREPILMILLLRKPHEFSEEEIRRAAEAAWTLSFPDVEGSTRLVSSSDDAVFLQAGPHRISFHSRSRPYENNPEKNLSWLQKPTQQRAWAEHRACCWVNYATTTTDVELAHCVLAKIVVQLLDENCTGIYIPSEFSLIPAEAAFEALREMGSYRFSGLVPEL